MGRPGEVEIIVADTGCGLGPEEKDHLFEKFTLSRSKADGTGLGLYICKTLVEANQGRIWVESETSRGTTFHLAFPAAPEGEERLGGLSGNCLVAQASRLCLGSNTDLPISMACNRSFLFKKKASLISLGQRIYTLFVYWQKFVQLHQIATDPCILEP